MTNTFPSVRSGARFFAKAPLVVALVAASQGLSAQQGGLEEVVVTAQKRAQNLQDVPISIETLSTQKIAELGIQDFGDYARMLPSISVQPPAAGGVGFFPVYMRGITTGRDGQATTSQPRVGM